MSNKVFLVHVSYGDHDAYTQVPLFCCRDVKTAASYVEKLTLLTRKRNEIWAKIGKEMEHWEVDHPRPYKRGGLDMMEWANQREIKHKEVYAVLYQFSQDEQSLIDTFHLSDYLMQSDSEYDWAELSVIE